MAWNRPTSNTGNATSSSRPSGRGKMPRLHRGLIAGVIVVLGAGLAAWLLTNGEAASSPLQKKDRGLIREVTPAAAPVMASAPSDRAEETVSRPAAQPSRDADAATAGRQEAKKKKNGAEPNASDQLLGMSAALASGRDVPPMPIGPGATRDFKESLKHEIVINENDSEEVKATKERLIAFREELKQLIANGEKVEDILREHESVTRDNNRIRNEIISEVKALREKGDEKEAEHYLTVMNAAIQQMGIETVDVPLTDAEKEELEQQNEQE